MDEMKRVHCRMCAGSTWVCASLIAMSIFALSCSTSPSPPPESTSPPAPPVAERATSQEPPPSPVPTATPEPEKRATALAVPVAASNAAQSPSPASQDEQPSASATTSTPERTPVPAARGERSSGSSDTANTLPPAATSTGVSATSTEQTADADSPVGDCFGGALSEDPLHCYVLEKAQEQELIDIVAMYSDADRDVLVISISQDELEPELSRFTLKESYAFVEKWPELAEETYGGLRLFGEQCDSFPFCYITVTGGTTDPRYILPYSIEYGTVLFVPGGDAAVRNQPGWASWRQVWPAVASGASGASGASTTFDVSDLDMSNLPDATSKLGLAGSHGGEYGGGGTHYVQVKNPPTDEVGLQALRAKIDSCFKPAGENECTWTGADGKTRTRRIEFIPVKYHWAELRRWAETLNRFAVSSGNTIGITWAHIGTNQYWHHAVYLNGVTPVKQFPASALRETIVVWGGEAAKGGGRAAGAASTAWHPGGRGHRCRTR